MVPISNLSPVVTHRVACRVGCLVRWNVVVRRDGVVLALLDILDVRLPRKSVEQRRAYLAGPVSRTPHGWLDLLEEDSAHRDDWPIVEGERAGEGRPHATRGMRGGCNRIKISYDPSSTSNARCVKPNQNQF